MSITDFFSRSKPLINRFRLIRELEEGNFGKTFLAQDLHNGGRNCVIKKFLPNLSQPEKICDLYNQKARNLFKDEAILLGILGNHNQVPNLIANFQDKDDFYIVQEYIDGENLHSELENNGIFSEQKMWAFLIKISTALEYVHSHKIVHRDINPRNIMRRFSDDQIFLIDFGSAKQIHTTPSTKTNMTLDGTTLGTRGYTPYRQYHLGKVDYSNDIFSVGATCFHLMTNLYPPELYNRIGNGDKWVEHFLPYLNGNYSENLVSIIEKMLVQGVDTRYVSVSEMIADTNGLSRNKSTLEGQRIKKIEPDLSDSYIWTEEYKNKNLAQYKENIKVLEEKISRSEIEMPKSAYEAMKRDSNKK